MTCPKCHNEADGKWCKYCGARVEADDFDIMQYGNQNQNTDINRIRNRQKSAHSKQYRNGRSPMGIIVVIFVLMIVLVSLVLSIIFTPRKSEKAVDTKEVASSATKKEDTTEDLTAKAERYMEIGDYESAEKICKEIIDYHDDDKAMSMYKILYNYNTALKEFSEYKHKAARKSFEKIPTEYVDYAIASDVEALDEEITNLQVAYEIFENISGFIDIKDYKAAKAELSIINPDMLSPDDKATLDTYKQEIADNTVSEVKDKDDTDNSDKETDNKNENGTLSKGKVNLSMHEAENLARGYGEALIKATKEGNFDIAASYMHPDSNFYSRQKKTINKYISEGTTVGIDSFNLDNVTKISNTKWALDVRERETIYYTSGLKEQYAHTRTYTVEYIDSAFYITDIN